jgi:DNA-directed RNA polymerase I subunit RPA34.5
MSGGPIITQDKVSYCLQPTAAPNDALLLPEDADGDYRPSKFKISRGFQLKVIEKTPSGINGPSANSSSGSTADGLRFTAQGSGKPKPPREQPKGLRTHYVPYGVMDGERPAHEARSSRKADGLVNGASTSTSINRTPSKTKDSAPAASTGSTASNEATSPDVVSRDSLQKPAQPSPAGPSEEGTPKQRKRKKRSKLVDTPSL